MSEIQKFLVVEDHGVACDGTIGWLRPEYPRAEIFTAQTACSTLEQIERGSLDLVVLDIGIPQNMGDSAKYEIGIQVLKKIMRDYSSLNLLVQSTNTQSLVRIKSEIDNHEGGFTIVDKGSSKEMFLIKVDWSLRGVTHTKDIRKGNIGEFRPIWFEVLQLAYRDGLQDRVIAERLNVAPRTILHYWTKIRDALDVYPEKGQNLRIQTQIKAREQGLID